MKKRITIAIFILVFSVLGITKEKETATKLTPIYTVIVDFLSAALENPGAGYILRFSDNEQVERIPYLRFQAQKISKNFDLGILISTANDFGPVCGFYYRGVRFDAGLSVKLHTLTRSIRETKVSLIIGVSVPLGSKAKS
jgi:hypothetical protein